MSRTISLSAMVVKEAPLIQDLHEVVGDITASKVKPEDGIGTAYPPTTGTVWETSSPESTTIPVVRPEAYRDGDVHGRCVKGPTNSSFCFSREAGFEY